MRIMGKEFEDILVGKQHIVILTHMAPDGDAMGSALAMYHWIQICQSEGRSVSETVCQCNGLSAAPPRSMEEKVNVLKEHVLASIAWCGNDERKGIIHSRRHFAASPVFKGLFDFKQTRIALLRADTLSEVFTIMDEIVAKWSNE
jgi:hypothetical protein